MDYTKQLIRFCSELSFNELPAEVTHKAKLCVLDYVANIYGLSVDQRHQRHWAAGLRPGCRTPRSSTERLPRQSRRRTDSALEVTIQGWL
jgi:2-methylcitrate dehydratase PrpD